MNFEWDESKNRSNQLKHGISFEEVVTVFYDDYAIVFDDPDHSDSEERFLIIGLTNNFKICIVSHCYKERTESIRIISARKATKHESNYYHKNGLR